MFLQSQEKNKSFNTILFIIEHISLWKDIFVPVMRMVYEKIYN